jgi:alpha-L-rhamnosidase
MAINSDALPAALAKSVNDPCVRRFVPPTRVVWASAQNVAGSDNLLRDDTDVCKLSPASAEADRAAIVIDFGLELHGGVRIHADAASVHRPTRVRIRFGESVAEAMGTPNNDHAIHDYVTEVAWMGVTEIGTTGFRFVRIDLLDDESLLPIRYVEAVLLFRDMPKLGTFESSDACLNRIFDVGAWTVQLCCQDHIWDGIKRDRLVWIGDLHPEAMVVSSVFGNQPIVQTTLDWARDRTPLPGWMNGISSYSLWWLISQRDWFRAQGNLDYLKQQHAYLVGLLQQVQACVDAEGVEHLADWRFLEWPTSGDPVAVHAGLQGLTVLALRAGAELCSALGLNKESGEATAVADRASRATINPPSVSKQANALLALAGMVDAKSVNEKILAADPYRGLSTFYGYYVLQARALAGDYQGTIDLIRTYWGGMLDAGATTFWEGFEIDWLATGSPIDRLPIPGKPDIHSDFGDYCYKGLRHSLCHGWAAGPTAWLLQHILGVAPASPGCKTVTIQPHLADLACVRGTYPTPHGLIHVNASRRSDGTVHTEVKLPDGVRQVDPA